MLNRRQLASIFRKVQVVRAPKHRLATFGTTRIEYRLITDVTGMPDRARVRSGRVIAERPRIIAPRALRDRFSGFGPGSEKLAETLAAQYGDALRGLDYQFHNEPGDVRIELAQPARLAEELARRMDADGNDHAAVLTGSDRIWEMSVMKFIVEETIASFTSNVRELEEHGFFDSDDEKSARRHAEIRTMLRKAATDRSLIPTLAARLKSSGLFDMYQDEFFRLVNN